jgi:exopolyphosphatase/guanosine-5'-triphosphate,3'-diphosphate pyrophosphatase
MNLATVDIGTNTALLLVARVLPDGTLELVDERAEITRLGRGIGAGGALGQEGIARTLAALREYAIVARRHQAKIAAIGTEALRRAPNAAAFLEPAAEILGAPIEVIDGAREAALTFRAVADAFPSALAGALTVVDIGGGSTEIVIATGGSDRFG